MGREGGVGVVRGGRVRLTCALISSEDSLARRDDPVGDVPELGLLFLVQILREAWGRHLHCLQQQTTSRQHLSTLYMYLEKKNKIINFF